MLLPATLPMREGQLSPRPAVMLFCTGELMKMWNSGLETSPVQPSPSLKAQEPCRRGSRKTVSQKMGEGLSSAILQAWHSHDSHALTASRSHLHGACTGLALSTVTWVWENNSRGPSLASERLATENPVKRRNHCLQLCTQCSSSPVYNGGLQTHTDSPTLKSIPYH